MVLEKSMIEDTLTLSEHLECIDKYICNPKEGLPEEVFLFATEITPMVNVDLLVRDKNGRILLSWRKDKFYDEGWHVPGGIIRLKETFEERIRKVASIELGCEEIYYNPTPIDIVPIICPHMKQRGHFISFIYECSFPDNFEIKNHVEKNQAGYLKWHSTCPDNLLSVHSFYRKYW